MRSGKIFIAFSSFILTIASIFATTKKPHSIVTSIYYTLGGFCNHFNVVAGFLFTTGSQEIQATIKTRSGTSKKLWGSCVTGITAHPVHAHF